MRMLRLPGNQAPPTCPLQVPAARQRLVDGPALRVQIAAPQHHGAAPGQRQQQNGRTSQGACFVRWHSSARLMLLLACCCCCCRCRCCCTAKALLLRSTHWGLLTALCCVPHWSGQSADQRAHCMQPTSTYSCQVGLHFKWGSIRFMAQSDTLTFCYPNITGVCPAGSPTPTATCSLASSSVPDSPLVRMIRESGNAPSTGSTTPPTAMASKQGRRQVFLSSGCVELCNDSQY